MTQKRHVLASCDFDEFGAMYQGKAMNDGFYTVTIAKTDDQVHLYGNERDGTFTPLCIVKRNAIGKNMQKLAMECYEKTVVKSKTTLRGMAMGTGGSKQNTKRTTSLLAGYWDTRDVTGSKWLKKYTDTRVIGNVLARPTIFTLKKRLLWNRSLQLFDYFARLYRQMAPKEYSIQMKECNQVLPQFRIADTPYTSITVNYNWSTCVHVDSGNTDRVWSSLAIVGSDNWAGCDICFPRFKVRIEAGPGDFILMNPHEWHCNTKMINHGNSKTHTRISFVCYLRSKMKLADTLISEYLAAPYAMIVPRNDTS